MREQVEGYIWAYNAADPKQPYSAWRHFLQIVTMAVRDFMSGMITLRAMSLVYTTLLSVVPLLAVSIVVLRGFGVHGTLQPALASLLAPLGERSDEVSARIVGFVDNMSFGVLGALGLVMLLYTVISLVVKIESAFNYTWRLRGTRSMAQRFSNYLSVIMVGPLLMFGAVGITASLGNNQVVEWLNALPYMNNLLRLLGKLLPFAMVIAAFTLVYLLVPNTRVRLKSALYGAVIAGGLWQSAGMLFTAFAGGATSYTAIYSGLAILLLFMIWLYISWVIVLIGASISYYHQHPQRLNFKQQDLRLSARMREQLALQAMHSIAQAHDRMQQPPTLDELAAYQQLPADLLQRLLDALEDDGLLRRTADEPGGYVPGAALNRIRLADILRCARYAEDGGQVDTLRRDAPVAELVERIEQRLAEDLGDATLAELVQAHEDEKCHETSLV